MSRFFKSKRRVTPHPLFLQQETEKALKNKKLDSWKTPETKKITVRYQSYGTFSYVTPISSIKDKYTTPCVEGDTKYYRDSEFENTPGYCFAKALLFLQDKQTGVALQYLNEAISLDDKYAKAYKERGRIYKSQGNIQLARNDFNTALNIEPDDFFSCITTSFVFVISIINGP